MASRYLSESAWKTVAAKCKVKDNGLQRALAAFEKLGDAGDPAARQEALDGIDKLAEKLLRDKAVAAAEAASDHLEALLKESARARQAAEKDARSPEAKAAAAKPDDDEKGGVNDLLAAGLNRVKSGGGKVALPYIVCPGTVFGIAVAKRITPELKEELKKATGATKVITSPGMTVTLEEGRVTFVTDTVRNGFAANLQKAIKRQTGKPATVRVRDVEGKTVIEGDADREDDASASDVASGATSKAIAGADAQKTGAASTVSPLPGNLVNKPVTEVPDAGVTKEGKTELNVDRDAHSAEGGYSAKKVVDDGKGGKSELTGKASVKADRAGNVEGGVSIGGSSFDEKGAGGALGKKVTGKIDAKTGEASIGTATDVTVKDAQGGETKASAGVSTAGAEIGGTRTKRVGEESGSSVGGKANVDWSKGTAGVAVEKKSQKKDEAEKSVGGSVTGTKSADGGGEVAIGASGGTAKGDKSQKLAVSFTIKSTWKVTKEETGAFLVEYVGGGKASAGRSGVVGGDKKVGASLGVSGGDEWFFQRRFATEKEARDFCAAHKTPPTSGADADVGAMKAGDAAGTTKSVGVGGGATANVEGISVGATLNWGASTTVRIEKQSAAEVRVTFVDMSQFGAGASLGAVATMGVDWTKQKIDYRTVMFQIATAAGAKAFNEFRKTGKLAGKEGFEVLATGRTTLDKMQKTIGFGPASIAFGATTSSTEETDAQGRKVNVEEGTAEIAAEFKPFGGAITLPGGKKLDTKWISDWHKEKHTLSIRAVDGQPAFVLKSNVDSKGAKGTGRVLADVTGSDRSAELVEDESAGKWTAEMPVSVQDMQKFSDKVVSGEAEKVKLVLGVADLGAYEALRKDLGKAGDDGKAWYQALTTFFSETGARGIRFLEVLIGKREMEVELDPAADTENVWLNLEEFEALGNQLGVIEKRIAAKKTDQTLRIELSDVKAALKKKADLVTNDQRYKEVPADVKKRYAAKLKKLLARMKEAETKLDAALAGGKPAKDAASARFLAEGADLLKAMESAEDGVGRWKEFVKRTWDWTREKTAGGAPPRDVTKPVEEGVAAGDEALAQYASSHELAERGLAELKANPCDEALQNLTVATTEGRGFLKTSYDGYRKAWTGLQGLRDHHLAGFEKNRKDRPSLYAGVRFALEDFPKKTPADVAL